MTISQLINSLALQRAEREIDSSVETYEVSLLPSGYYQALNQFFYIEGWDDGPYRQIWASDAHLAVFTYCEGGGVLEVANSEASYKALIQKAHEFYVACEGANLNAGTWIPQQLPIAQAAIEEIPGIDQQPWRQYHLFLNNVRPLIYSNAIISDSSIKVVLKKAIEICLASEEELPQLLEGVRIENLCLKLKGSGFSTTFGKSSLYQVLASNAPELCDDKITTWVKEHYPQFEFDA